MITIKKAASLTGLSVKAIRHYESCGLMPKPERSSAGYRMYSESDIARLQQIRYFREMKFPLTDIAARIPQLLDDVQQGLYDKAKKNMDEHIYPAYSLEEAKELQEKNGGFIKTMWCGDLQCELDMKEKAGMSSRCIPFEQEHLGDVCACCGKPAKHMIYWGVAY